MTTLTANIAPQELRCEYLTNPIGIDAEKPRLSWTLKSDARGAGQTAYQILASPDEAALGADRGKLWDSGKRTSAETAQIEYAGKALTSRERIYWKARAWDRGGCPSEWSEPAVFEMGLLEPADWKGRWVSHDTGPGSKDENPPSPYLRRDFAAKQPVYRARLYATALGLYRAFINGKRVGEDLFTPGWTDYRTRVPYQTYDITDLVMDGANTVGVTLADGWYAGQVGWADRCQYGPRARFLGQIELEYADGSTQIIPTDALWRGSDGPIRAADNQNGETYDARREMPGWSEPGFDASAWRPADTLPAPDVRPLVHYDLWSADAQSDRTAMEGIEPAKPVLVAHVGPLVQVTQELVPVAVTRDPQGNPIFDLGQNMVGWVRLKTTGPAGTTVTIRFAEMLNPDGTLYTTNLRGARCTDTYTLKGGGEEVWEPAFTFHGFRYVELSGLPGDATDATVTGIVVHSNTPPAGTFECSHPLVNQLQSNIVWGQRGNFLEVPTDCPQRDERLGWMGDAQIFVRTACLNMDVAAFFTKWMRDVQDTAAPDGSVSDFSPNFAGVGGAAPAWGDAAVICPWTIFACYRDIRILADNYHTMRGWVDFCGLDNPDFIRRNHRNADYGDWLSIEADTPKDLLATAYYAYSADLLARSAELLGKTEDAATYRALFENIKQAFCKEYVTADGRIAGDTQTGYVLALHFNLLPEALRAAAADHLVEAIEQKSYRLSTGFVGVGYLLPALTATGHIDTAFRLLLNTEFPSWGYSIKHGATTIWERWDGWTEDKGFQDPGMNSFNHYSLGSVGEWLYTELAGLDPFVASRASRTLRMAPRPGGGITWAKAKYRSMLGQVSTSWKLEEGVFVWDVSVPPNAEALLTFPKEHMTNITEGDRPVAEAEGVAAHAGDAGQVVLAVQSGTYRFRS